MEITQVQYNQIAPYMPRQRGNVSLSNLQVLNAILYVVESGCMWRGLPERFGNWHTVYTRMNRWEKAERSVAYLNNYRNSESFAFELKLFRPSMSLSRLIRMKN